MESPILSNLNDGILCSNDIFMAEKLSQKLKTIESAVIDEFFGVYCLISESGRTYFKNRCYIGFTVDPNRRIRQHNAGKSAGGARKTDNRGPWNMICIVHGFPSSVSALRFEWAWQNHDKSRRLKSLKLRKSSKESPFAFRFRILTHMLQSEPWNRLALTLRWFNMKCKLAFPNGLEIPSHMDIVDGLVQKSKTFPDQIQDVPDFLCAICNLMINQVSDSLHCENGGVHCSSFHTKCLGRTFLVENAEYQQYLWPISGHCPKCYQCHKWGDLIRTQHRLIAGNSLKESATIS